MVAQKLESQVGKGNLSIWHYLSLYSLDSICGKFSFYLTRNIYAYPAIGGIKRDVIRASKVRVSSCMICRRCIEHKGDPFLSNQEKSCHHQFG